MAIEINSFNLFSKNTVGLVYGLCEFFFISFRCLYCFKATNACMNAFKLKLIFTARSPTPGEIFCRPSDGMDIENTTSWIESAHKKKFNRVENEESYDFCLVNGNVVEENYNYSGIENYTLVECEDFEHRPIFYSIIHQYGLICSREAHIALSQSFHLLGVLIGGIISFYMLKRFFIANLLSDCFYQRFIYNF